MKTTNIIKHLDLPGHGEDWKKRISISQIIVHHTESPNVSPFEVSAWHVAKGWRRISYHYFITPHGTTFKCNEDDDLTWHCKGHNTDSLGIALSGDFDRHHPTGQQLEKLVELCCELASKYDIASDNIKGHCEFKAVRKTCPGKHLDMRTVRSLVAKCLVKKYDIKLSEYTARLKALQIKT